MRKFPGSRKSSFLDCANRQSAVAVDVPVLQFIAEQYQLPYLRSFLLVKLSGFIMSKSDYAPVATAVPVDAAFVGVSAVAVPNDYK